MGAPTYSDIDPRDLPKPEALIELSFDDILAEVTAKFKADNPILSESLNFESEPITALNQAWAYREFVFRQYVNSLFLSSFLAYATGSALDHIGALIPLSRLDGETDDDFRSRIRLAPEGFSTAGSVGAYEFHARSAHPDVLDVYVTSPGPSEVKLYILSEDGSESGEVIEAVENRLGDDVRDLCALVSVEEAEPVDFNVNAQLTLSEGASLNAVSETAMASVQNYLRSRYAIGRDVPRSGLIAALHVVGVEKVELTSPVADISPENTQFANAASIAISEAANE